MTRLPSENEVQLKASFVDRLNTQGQDGESVVIFKTVARDNSVLITVPALKVVFVFYMLASVGFAGLTPLM